MSRGRTVLVALGLAVLVVWLTGAIPRWGLWYSDQPFYRAQVHAFFEGRLALSHDVEGVTHDLAYVDDGVQQVWGLGVPIWLSFWEVIGRPFGLSPFPERIAMLFGIALVMFALLRAWVGSSGDRTAASWGAFLLTAIVPGVYSMMRGRMVVYEEASAYAYGTAMLLLVGVIAMLRRPSTSRYLWIVGFAGLTGLMRPTVWFYGGATAGVATLLYIQHRGSLRRAAPAVALASALFVAGGGVLYLTNHLRFGDGAEFGHKLNLEDLPGNMYSTRFEYPFQNVPVADAAKELVGGLFGSPERRARPGYHFYDQNLHTLQSEYPRWREYYFGTYRWVHLPLILLGLALTAVCWLRVREHPDSPASASTSGVIVGPALARESRWLGLWAIVAMTPLLLFYLRSPSVSSRYFLDLAPAFVVLIVIVWRHATQQVRAPAAAKLLIALLATWLVYSSVTYKIRRRWYTPIAARQAVASMREVTEPARSPRRVPAAYDLDDPWLGVYIGGDQLHCKCFADELGDRTCDHLLYGETDVTLFYNEPKRQPILVARIDYEVEPVCVSGGDWPTACSLADPDPVPPDALPLDPGWRIEQRRGGALYRNGTEWDIHTGAVGPSTYFFVDSPEYVEVEVAPRNPTELTPQWEPQVRAKVQLEELALESMASTPRGVRLRFAGPTTPRYRTGLEVVFLAFGPPEDIDKEHSTHTLWRLSWRDDASDPLAASDSP